MSFSESQPPKARKLAWAQYLDRLIIPEVVEVGGLVLWRERIYIAMMIPGLVLALISLVPSVHLALKEGLWDIAVTNCTAWVTAAVLVCLRRLNRYLRYGGLACLMYAIGVHLLYRLGFYGAGLLYLFAFSVTTGVLLGLRPALIALCVTYLTMGLMTWGLYAGALPWPGEVENLFQKWIISTVNFFFLNTAVSVSLAMLLRGLEATVEELGEAVTNLEDEISIRKQAEQERRQLEAQLRQAQKMEAIGTLAGGIAHDFNNIVYGILLGAETVQGRLSRQDPSWEFLEQIRKASHRAAQLTKQLLTFSRQSQHDLAPLLVEPLVKETLNLLRATLPSTVIMRQRINAPGVHIMAEPTLIHQVLMNLCTNAAQALESSGGQIEVGLEVVDLDQSEIRAYGELPPGSYVRLTVADTGPGVPAHLQERIFDPFFTTKPPGQGTGLGLSVVLGIVGSLHGAIRLDSEPGEGARFEVILPVVQGEARSRPGPPAQEESRSLGEGESILVVDDDSMVVDMVRGALESLGYRVSGATSGLEALALFKAEPQAYDLVIVDQTMPRMTGADLAQEMLLQRPELPIILCTGYGMSFSPEKAKALGLAGFVRKPLDSRALARLVRQSLDARGRR